MTAMHFVTLLKTVDGRALRIIGPSVSGEVSRVEEALETRICRDAQQTVLAQQQNIISGRVAFRASCTT